MTTYVYISLQKEDRISLYVLDPEDGRLTRRTEFPLSGMPAPMAVDPQRRFVFVGRRQPGDFGLTSYAIDHATGRLTELGGVPLEGDPVHISVDRTGKYLLSAHYYQARVGVHGFGDDGVLAATPSEWRETGIGAHYVQTDPSNRYAYVPHIAEGSHSGLNAIFQFRFDQLTGRLAPCDPDRVVPNAPEGPRHLCFHPNLDVVYSSNEQGCSVTAYRFGRAGGTLSPFPDRTHAAGGLHGAQLLFPDTDNAVGQVPVRAESGPQQHCRVRRGRRRRHTDAPGPDADGGTSRVLSASTRPETSCMPPAWSRRGWQATGSTGRAGRWSRWKSTPSARGPCGC